MVDPRLVQEIKDRLADRFTAAELVDLLNIAVEDIIEENWEKILDTPSILKDVGATE
jgi:hypothetical protein